MFARFSRIGGRWQRRAFTLVELLVVIAVIALLASILFPVLNRAREQSLRVVCLSNINQGSRAIFLYANDNGERCVPVESRGFGQAASGIWNGPTDHDMAWPEIVQPYVAEWTILRCPADRSATDDSMAFEFDDATPIPRSDLAKRRWVWAFRSNFGLNFNWLSYPTECYVQGPTIDARLNTVPSPPNTLMLIDSVWGRQADGSPTRGGSWAVDAPARPFRVACYLGGWRCWTHWSGDPESPDCLADPLAWGGAYPHHTSHTVFNAAFVDGHVKGERVADLLAGIDPKKELITDPDACIWDTIR